MIPGLLQNAFGDRFLEFRCDIGSGGTGHDAATAPQLLALLEKREMHGPCEHRHIVSAVRPCEVRTFMDELQFEDGRAVVQTCKKVNVGSPAQTQRKSQ